jgi:hypothetical protein
MATLRQIMAKHHSLTEAIKAYRTKNSFTPAEGRKVNKVLNSVSQAGKTLQTCGYIGGAGKRACSKAGHDLKAGDISKRAIKKSFFDQFK